MFIKTVHILTLSLSHTLNIHAEKKGGVILRILVVKNSPN